MMNASPVPLLILNRGLAASFALSSSTRRLFCSACAALAVSAFAASLASRALSSSRRCFFLPHPHPLLPLAWPAQAGGAASTSWRRLSCVILARHSPSSNDVEDKKRHDYAEHEHQYPDTC